MRPDYCPVANAPCQSMCETQCSIRSSDEELAELRVSVAAIAKALHNVTAERDRLLRNEYICIKCGLRKDGEKVEADF